MSYNGWENYETWLVSVHISNDPYLLDQVEMNAESTLDDFEPSDQLDNLTEKSAEFVLADDLERLISDIVDRNQKSENHLVNDLLQASINKVDWYEIAEHYIEEAECREEV